MRIHRSKILVLALTSAASLMALSAGPALAVNLNLGDKFYENNQTPPEFLINSGTLSPTGLTTQAIKATQIGSMRLAIPAKKVEIVCQKGEITGTAANEYENFIAAAMETGAHAAATLTGKECTVEEMESQAPHKLTGKFPTCIPNYNTIPGEIQAQVLLLGKKHESVPYIVAVPRVSSKASALANEALTSAFMKITFDIEKCAPVQTSNLTGSFSFKWPNPTVDAINPAWKINTLGGDALIGTKLKFGNSEAFIEVEYKAELPNNVNTPWGVM